MEKPDRTIHLGDAIPEENTPEMSVLLHSIVEQVLQQLPFPFTAGCVMEMATKLVVDAGMISVMEGKQTREELKGEIVKVISAFIDVWQFEQSNIVYREGVSMQ